jgi:hypothetical protein
MGYFRVRLEHLEPGAADVLIQGFRVQSGPIQSRHRPMLHLSTGVVRMPSAGDWIVSKPDEGSIIMLHEDFIANYEPAN